MKLDKTFKTLVVLGSDYFRPYYNTIVDAAYDASCFHLSFSSRGDIWSQTLVSAGFFCLYREEGWNDLEWDYAKSARVRLTGQWSLPIISLWISAASMRSRSRSETRK